MADPVDALAKGVKNAQLDDHYVTVPYYDDDGKQCHAKVPRVPVSLLRDLLIPESSEGKPVVFFGEGNFTFSVAFASMRGSWRGIISTRFEAASEERPKPKFDYVNLLAIDNCIHNGEKFEDDAAEILGKVKKVLSLRMSMHGYSIDTWQFKIDATKIPANLHVNGRVVWFQCPWTYKHGKEIYHLISNFLTHMSEKQSPGDFVLIGICVKREYVEFYHLQDLLGENLAQKQACGYEFCGVDSDMIQQILRYGYRHQGIADIHDIILKDHVTLVFCKLHHQAN